MITEQDVARYLEKSGDPDLFPHIVEAEGHGFAAWEIQDDRLVIGQVYGDGEWWAKQFRAIAKYHGCKQIIFATKRSPKAFERKFGAKLVGYLMELPLWAE